MHFQVGNCVDVRGKTIDRGLQGVMKRHGFSGMPASHGVTKNHRRGGSIGGGGEKGRVWPGTKMPGHMGNRYRTIRGLKIWRINTKYSVMWVSGQAIPGETNSIVTVFDTLLPLRKPSEAIPLPTYLQKDDDEFPENIYDKDIHIFNDLSGNQNSEQNNQLEKGERVRLDHRGNQKSEQNNTQSEKGNRTRSGRIVSRPKFLSDYVTK